MSGLHLKSVLVAFLGCLLSLVSSVTFAADPMQGYTQEDLDKNPQLKDRLAIQAIQQALNDRFVGNQVFPSDGNNSTKDYIGFLLKPFLQFYLNEGLPETMRMLPVAGPSGVAKTLIVREAVSLLIEYGLLSPERSFFRQGDEEGDIDLTVLDMFKVPEATIEEFKISKTYDRKKAVFLKVMAFIVFDEASHMPALGSDNLEEAIKIAVENYRIKHPRKSEQDTDVVERPKEPKLEDFKNDPDPKKKLEEASAQYDQDYARYVTANQMTGLRQPSRPTLSALSRDEEIRRVVMRVIAQFYAQRRLAVIETEVWQSLSGGRIAGTTREDVATQLKLDMEDVLKRIATVQAKFRQLPHANNEDPRYLETQIDEMQTLQKKIHEYESEISKLKKQDTLLRSAGPMFATLTLAEAQKWCARSGKWDASFADKTTFENLSGARRLEIILSMAKDYVENPEAFAGKTKGLDAFSAFKSKEEPAPLFQHLGYHDPAVFMASFGNIIRSLEQGIELTVASNTLKINLILERQDAYVKSAKIGPTYAEIVSEYAAYKAEFEQLIYEAVRTSEPVASRIKGKLEKTNPDTIANYFPEYGRELIDIDQLDPGQYFKDLIHSGNPSLMFRELERMDRQKAFALVIDTINEGNLGTTVHYSLGTAVFLQNVLPIEKRVQAMMAEARAQMIAKAMAAAVDAHGGRAQGIDYDTYAGFYYKILSDPTLPDWSEEFYKVHFPHLLKMHNPQAAKRRLGGEIGPLFITPPNSLEVANLVERTISTVFEKWRKKLPGVLATMRVDLHLDRNVAMALVTNVQDASLGVAQTLSRVESEFYLLTTNIEARMLQISRSKGFNAPSDKLHLVLNLEKGETDNDHILIAARIGPPNLVLNSVYKEGDLKGVTFPANSLIASTRYQSPIVPLELVVTSTTTEP